jgi:hypothetical protein
MTYIGSSPTEVPIDPLEMGRGTKPNWINLVNINTFLFALRAWT